MTIFKKDQVLTHGRSRVSRLLPVLLLLSLALGSGGAPAANARVLAPPPGLTASGRLLWNFEALLRDTFGPHYQGCLRALDRYTETFTTGQYCKTHDAAHTMYYSFAFAKPAKSAFHLVVRTFPAGAFGNYPEPVRVENDFVACDPAGRTFLISYGDVIGLSANLACSRPNP